MRLTRIGWLALAAVLICGGLLTLAYLHRRAREYTFPDGSVVRLQKVYYGKPEKFDFDGWIGRLKKRSPQFLANLFSKATNTKPGPSVSYGSWWSTSGLVHSNENALYIYVTRRDAAGKLQDVALTRARLLDQHGCVFEQISSDGEDDGRILRPASATLGMMSAVIWFRFEAFPRYEPTFRLQLGDLGERTNRCEFVVANPFPPNTPRRPLTAQPFPIKQTDGAVTFILNRVNLQTNASVRHSYYVASPFQIVPTFTCMEGGHVSSDWQALDMELYDSSGNFSGNSWTETPMLCTNEPAWKMRLRFFGSEESSYASNSTWTLHNLTVPDAGRYTNLNTSQFIEGVSITISDLAGRGDYSYSSDGLIESGSSLKNDSETNKLEFGTGTPFYYLMHGKTPHITLKLGNTTDDQRVTVRAIDEKERKFSGHDMGPWGTVPRAPFDSGRTPYLQRQSANERTWISFDLPPDSKKIDLTFCVHTCRTVDFVFKPPTIIMSAITNAAK